MNDGLKLAYADIPAPLREMAQAPSLQRLRQVGMNCGCEYTSVPMFRRPETYHRYEHSLGVALIVWRFTGDLAQTAAGLLHDIATPVFAHVVDFVRGDYLRQEATEAGTRECIAADAQLVGTLSRYGLTVDDVCDYHRYPIADNDSPRLSADRLEYTLGNIVHYGFDTAENAMALYRDLTVLTNEEEMPEIGFAHEEQAVRFAELSLRCSKLYVSPEDRYAMQRLSEILRTALAEGVLTPAMLYSTEPEVIRVMEAHPATARAWRDFRDLRAVRLTREPAGERQPRIVPAKKRSIDPLIRDMGRVSQVNAAYRDQLKEFLDSPQDEWICEAESSSN